MDQDRARCVRCDRTSDQVPLLELRYRDQTYWICPQDLPILIHRPEQIESIAGDWTRRQAEPGAH